MSSTPADKRQTKEKRSEDAPKDIRNTSRTGQETSAKKRKPKETRFFDWNSLPVRWDDGKFPMRVANGKEIPIYTLQKLFNEAIPISEKDFDALIQRQINTHKQKQG